MRIWISKHRWLCIGLCGSIFLLCALSYLYMIYPRYTIDDMESVEINMTLDGYIHCENCEDITYQLVDEAGRQIDSPQLNTTYTCAILFVSDWVKVKADVPVRFIDTTPPEVAIRSKQIELEWGESFDATQYITAIDNSNGSTSVEVTVDFDPTIVDQLQTLHANVCDESGNCSAVDFDVIQNAPLCAENAHFDGTTCRCNDGYEGDGWSECKAIVVQPTSRPVSPPVMSSTIEQPTSDDAMNQAQSSSQQQWNDPTVSTDQSIEASGWDEPEWGYNINSDETDAFNQGMDACVAAGEADHGKPDNATGYSCLTQGDGYTLTWFDQNGNAIASIHGF